MHRTKLSAAFAIMAMTNKYFSATNDEKTEFMSDVYKECLFANATHSQVVDGSGGAPGAWCPKYFDGFACWDQTPAGSTAVRNCPEYIRGFDHRRKTYKGCDENGTWYEHPINVNRWSNYTSCIDIEDLRLTQMITNIIIAAYSVSIVALLAAFGIFFFFRTLMCTRVEIHMNLMVSLALSDLFWIIWYSTVANTAEVVYQNQMYCKILHILCYYLSVTSYFWMFNEGLHLYLALVVVFVEDLRAMRWFKAIGWVAPLIIMIAYSCARFYSGSTDTCWMDEDKSFWFIGAPVAATMCASFTFMVKVIQVLVRNLNPGPNDNVALYTAKRATKAAVVLVPLFGINFILIPLTPVPGSALDRVYSITSIVLTTLQGISVPVLFCFINADVHRAIKAYILRYRRRHEALTFAGATQGNESTVNIRENPV